MQVKLFDSELKVMDVLWREKEQLTASQIVKILKEEVGWNRNTTYTIIKKCIEKGVIERQEPNFICKALISKEEVQEQETSELISKFFDGSPEQFFSAFIHHKGLTKDQISELKKIMDDYE